MQGLQKDKTDVSFKCESVWFKVKLTSQFLTLSFLLTQSFFLSYLHAAPTGGNVVGGTGSISQNDLTTTINQTSQQLAVDWQSFDVNTNEKVNFVQPNTSSIALNRILGNNGSTIQGQINANGQVILVNPNGVFFTPTATINVGGLVATSLDMTPSDFMNGNYIFNEVIGADGTVINSGIINASTGGNVALLGKQVKNEGLISANLGSVVLAAGKQSVLTFDNQGLLGIKVTKEVLQDELGIKEAVINNGDIKASGGRVLLTASTSQDVFSQAVNTNQLAQAKSVVVHEDGSFTLGDGADVLNRGSIDVSSETNIQDSARIVLIGENITSSGEIKADVANGNAGEIELHAKDKTLLTENSLTSAQAHNFGKGGLIKILGDKVGLFDQSEVNATGANGGGEVLIGGDRQGLNSNVRNASFIYLGEMTAVNADATNEGDGGKIITFAEDTARIHGSLFARGGTFGGNGGFIETSGLRGFEITKAPDVSAYSGKGGLWLIDPYNITIVNDATATPTSTNILESTSGGIDVFTSNGDSAVLEVGLIEQSLLTQNVEITTGTGTTTEFGDISFQADLVFDINGGGGGSTKTLTLNAARDITFTNASSITSTTNDSLNLILNAGRHISLSSDIANINGFNGINLQGGDFDINSVGGTVTFNTGTIDTGGGNIDITNSNIVDFNGATILTAGGDFDITNNTSNVTSSAASSVTTSDGNFTVSNSADLNLGNVNINVSAGDFDLDGSGNGVTGNIVLGSISANNLFSTQAANMSQSAGSILTIASSTDLDVTSSTGTQLITLTNTGNNFNTIKLKGDVVKVTDLNSIDIADSIITNTLEITAGTVSDGTSHITNSGAVTVLNAGTGNANFSAGGNITFGGSDDDFERVNFQNAQIVNVIDMADGIAIAANSSQNNGGVTGNLTIEVRDGNGTGANITNYGEINAGTSTFDTANFIVEDGQSIYLENLLNTFNGNISFSSNGSISNIDITDTTALTLPSIDISGYLNIIADSIQLNDTTVGGLLSATSTNASGGDITQVAGVLDISGSSTFDATRDVILGFDNNFRDTVAVVKARNATFADVTGIQLGKITVSGNLSVTSDSDTSNDGGEDITQLTSTGNGISVTGTSTFTANNQDISLTNSENDFDSSNTGAASGALTIISADEADITDANSIIFGNVFIDRGGRTSTFIAGASGTGASITQVAGTSFDNDNNSSTITQFDANGGSIVLENLTNDIRVIDVSNTATASITDKDYINLRNVAVSADLTLNAGNSRTSANNYIRDEANANISVGGTLNLTSRAGALNSHILLDSANANYNVINIVNAANVDITDNTDSVGIQGTVTGNLSLTANGTSGTNVITNPGALIVSGNADFAANDNQSIDLSNAANSFSNDPDFTANSGQLNNINISDITALQLQDNLDIRGDLIANASTVTLQNTLIGGNLDLTATTTINQAGGKSVTIAGVSTLNGTSIDFSNSGNDFQSDVTVTNANAAVSLRDDAGGISLGSTSNAFTSANLTVDSNGGDISQNNSITTGFTTLDAGSDDVLLNTNASNNFSAGVSITSARDAFISDINTLNIASSNTTRDLNINATGALTFGSSASSNINIGRNLIFTAGGSVTQAVGSTIDVVGDSQMTARNGTTDYNIILDSSNNNFNAVNIINAALVNLRDSTGYIDISGNISGNLTVRADDTFITTDIIRNSAALSVAGNSTFTAAAGKSMDLSNSSNVFTGSVNFTNSLQNLNLNDNSALTIQNNLLVNNDFTVTANSLNFNSTTVNGNFLATTNAGLLTQAVTTGIQVGGISTLNGGSGGIDLRGTNDFNGAVSLQTTSVDVINNPSNVIIRDVLNDFELGSSNIQGGLSVTANSISQSGGVTVANTSSFIASANRDISLMHAGNNFNEISFSASTGMLQNVAINNSVDLTLGSINVTNNLTASSDGNIFNNGQLIVGGLTVVNANNITLDTLSNDLNNITVIGNNVSITDANNINFSGDSNITGNLTINAGTNISDDNNSQIIATSGISSFNVGNNTNNRIILDSPRHDFNEVRVVAGGDVIISDVNGFDMGLSNLSSNLYLIADSDNDQDVSNITNNGGAITVGGFTDITTSSGSSVSLTDSANDFGNYLTFNQTGGNPLGSIEISNTNNTLLDNVDATNLTVTSTGAASQDISQTTTSILLISNNTLFDTGTSDVTLINQINDFNNFSVSNAKNVTVTDNNTITVGSINATGTVTINSNGMVIGDITANTVVLNSGTSSISDGNGGTVNITSSGSVSLTATNGIGNGNPLELAMNGANANFSAFNSGSGNIEISNTGTILLDNISNTQAGNEFSIQNNGTVTVNSIVLDKSSDLSVATFDVTNGSVLGVQGNTKHLTSNTAIFNMNNTGIVGAPGSTFITDVPNKIEVVSSLGANYIEYYGQVPPVTFIGDNDYKNRALQAIESLSGQQLIEVESLAEIDPAIFTDVRNYSHSDIALMMPSDQRYDLSDDDEEDEEAKEKRNQLIHSNNL